MRFPILGISKDGRQIKSWSLGNGINKAIVNELVKGLVLT